MRRSGVADLPLHGGRVPAWLASRMEALGTAIAEAVLLHHGRHGLLARLSDPFWFQALGCVMGMDWHSSGITTSVMSALKRGLTPRAHELGVHICGGRGKQSLRTPAELRAVADRVGLDGEGLVRTSRLTARVDNNAIADGFQIYLHTFVLTAEGQWAVIQQGMNEATRLARRYHWHSATVRDFTADPHTAIVGAHAGTIQNLVDGRAGPAQTALLAIAHEDPAATIATVRRLEMPGRHDVRAGDVQARRLGAVLALAHERELHDFASFLLLEQLGPRTLQSLALIAEVVHGAPTRFDDPARFSFAHGGKDGHPFPVPLHDLRRVHRSAQEGHRLGQTGTHRQAGRDGAARRLRPWDRAASGSARRRGRHHRARTGHGAVGGRPHGFRRSAGSPPSRRRRPGSVAAVREIARPPALRRSSSDGPPLAVRDAEVPMATPQEVAHGVWMLRTVLVNVFVVRVEPDGWVLVDAGLPGSAAAIREAARALFGSAPPRGILLTHGHFDHVGALTRLLETWPVPVFAHPFELPHLTGRRPYPRPDPTVGGGLLAWSSFLFPRGPYDFGDSLLALPRDGRVPIAPDWVAVHTPGHTSGHVAFYRAADGTLIAGDAVTTTRQESAIAVATQRRELNGPPAYFTSDWDAARWSVQRLAAIGVETLLSGHGQPMAGGAMRRDLRDLAERFDERARPRRGRYVEHDEGDAAFAPRWRRPLAASLIAAASGALAIHFLTGAARRYAPRIQRRA